MYDAMQDVQQSFPPQTIRPGQTMPPQQNPDNALIKGMLAMQMQNPQQAQLQRQQMQADRLRSNIPGMQQSRSSIAAPNWAGNLAAVAANYKANQMDKQAQTGMEDLAGKRSALYEKLIGAL